MKQFWVKKVLGMVVCAVLGIIAIGFVVMTLWNHILVAVIGVKLITYRQALGIFVLSKLLFGGFGGGRRGCCWKGRGMEMKEKWQGMTPEEREKFKQDWRNRCSMWKMGKEEDC
jgi:hypothetical protein